MATNTLRDVPAGYAREGQGSSPLATAVECGLYEPYGLNVTLTKMGSAHAVVEGLVDGRILFGNLAAPALVTAVAEGARLVFLAGGVNQQFLVGAPGFDSLESVKGKNFAASGPGDLGDFLMEFTLSEILKGPGNIVYVGGGRQTFHALLDGRAQASSISPPTAMEAKRAGCPFLVDYADYDLNFAIGGIAARRDLVESEPNLVRTFLRGYLDGTKRYKTDREIGIKVHQKYGEVDADIAAEGYDVTHNGFRDFPDPATPGLQRLIDFWKGRGKLPANFSLDDVTDSGPVRELCAR